MSLAGPRAMPPGGWPPRIYLAGPIQGCNDQQARGWREEAKRLLPYATWMDPMTRDYREVRMDQEVAAQVVMGDVADLSIADAVLVNYPKPSTGTAMEVCYTYHCRWPRIPIIAFTGSRDNLSPWLIHHCTHIFQTLPQATSWLHQWAKPYEDLSCG
jgi:nucleoside 2-deoxyribosyltransferase